MNSEINQDNIADVLKSLGNNGAEAFTAWISLKNKELYLGTFVWVMFIALSFGTGVYIYDDSSNKNFLYEEEIKYYERLQAKSLSWEQEKWELHQAYKTKIKDLHQKYSNRQ